MPRRFPTAAFPALLLCCAAVLAFPRPAAAQQMTFAAVGMQLIGIHAGYNWTDKAPGLGLQARLPLSPKVDLAPSGDLYFKDNATQGQLNLDILGPFGQPGKGGYFGFGLGIVRNGGSSTVSNTTRIGPDFVMGITSTKPASYLARPYFEVRWTIVTGPNPFQLLAGLNFRLF
ncbi:MAG: hypothetical protein ACHQXA_04945 [Gemmatimonadales bacterium]